MPMAIWLCRCSLPWSRGVAVITTAQLHSTKPELRLCAGSNPAPGVSEIRNGEDLWQWCRLEIRLNAFRRSSISIHWRSELVWPRGKWIAWRRGFLSKTSSRRKLCSGALFMLYLIVGLGKTKGWGI